MHAVIGEVVARQGGPATGGSRLGAGARSGSSAIFEKARRGSGLEDSDGSGAAGGRGTSTLVVLGRSRRMAVEDHNKELKMLIEAHGNVGGEVRKTIGDVATALVVAGCNVGLVVLQASNRADA